MNISTLNYLLHDREEIIREAAQDAKVNEESAIGVAKQVIGESSATGLSGRQPYIFEKVILPLIENVPCNGWFDENDGDDGAHFECHSKVEEERLTHCYIEENMLCESCEEEQNFRAEHKASYMRD